MFCVDEIFYKIDILGIILGIYVIEGEDYLRLKDGDFYTDSRNDKVYRLNEDDKGSWYVSTYEDEGNDKLSRTSGREMMKLLKSFYTKMNDS